jgi:hypothetical protein
VQKAEPELFEIEVYGEKFAGEFLFAEVLTSPVEGDCYATRRSRPVRAAPVRRVARAFPGNFAPP